VKMWIFGTTNGLYMGSINYCVFDFLTVNVIGKNWLSRPVIAAE
jgi:hypothetical protein